MLRLRRSVFRHRFKDTGTPVPRDVALERLNPRRAKPCLCSPLAWEHERSEGPKHTNLMAADSSRAASTRRSLIDGLRVVVTNTME